jgi:predicted Zn-ribbon and HTH transcriptional regulator
MMKEKPKEPFTPPSMHDTIRQEIIAALLEGPCSARDLSAAAGTPEREVPVHLEHIRRSIAPSGQRLTVIPAKCKKCGFVFSKRDKLKRPGKCPVCKGESIREPRFMIEKCMDHDK